jgi:DNA ligase-associated metallophosphoesterase
VNPLVPWAGETLELRAERAVLLRDRATLLVADVHLGKARTFRRLGVPVPEGTTQGTLDRLRAVLAATRATRLVVLGDLLHSRHAQAGPAMTALAAWRAAHASLAITLVRGNHDDHAGDPPASLGIEVVDEPHPLGGLMLCHDAAAAASLTTAPRVGGHVHPCVRVSGRAHDSVRLPCFHFGAGFLVLPAFGEFTGMHVVHPADGERAWAIADDHVVEVR